MCNQKQQFEFAPLSATATRFCLAKAASSEVSRSQHVVPLTMGSFYAKAGGLQVCFSNPLALFLKCGQTAQLAWLGD